MNHDYAQHGYTLQPKRNQFENEYAQGPSGQIEQVYRACKYLISSLKFSYHFIFFIITESYGRRALISDLNNKYEQTASRRLGGIAEQHVPAFRTPVNKPLKQSKLTYEDPYEPPAKLSFNQPYRQALASTQATATPI